MDVDNEENSEEDSPEMYTIEESNTNGEADEKVDKNGSSGETNIDDEEIKALQKSLVEEPYNYSTHLTLINKLRTLGKMDLLRAARETMSSIYPLTTELWLNWIDDEIKLATTSDYEADVIKLYEQAVNDYVSVEIWLNYIHHVTSKIDEENIATADVRNLFERALTAVGLHTTKGAIIWETFREFEFLLFETINPVNVTERKEQLDHIGELFQRQLACSLLDMEKTREEYQSWRTGLGAKLDIDDKIVLQKYEEAYVKLVAYLPYEEKLVSAQEKAELLDAFKAYLMYEKRHGETKRVVLLYERAITDFCLETSIWLDYLTYLEDNIKIETVLDSTYQRAVKNIPWYSVVWQRWIRLSEKWNKPVSAVAQILTNALSVGFSTAEDYRNLWIVYIEFIRRKIPESKDTYLNLIIEMFNSACEQLARDFGLNGDPNCVILQYWARVEAMYADNMPKARALWSDILSQGHSETASYWLEYITLERCYGDEKHLRKLYLKALTAVKDWPESIANAWIDFERDTGKLTQMEFCEAKTKERLAEVAKERQKTITTESESIVQTKKLTKRKLDDSGKWKNLGSSPSKIVKPNVEIGQKLRKDHLDIKSKMDNIQEKSKIEDKDMNVDDQHEVNNDITVFISNLDYAVTEDEVRDALKPAGPITLFKMIKDYKGRNKGYCYVQLSNVDAVEKALKLDRVIIRERPMFVSRCNPDKNTRCSGFKYNSALEKNKLFVKGIPLTVTKTDLEKIFEAYGPLKEVRLVTYRNGHSKGLAYVEYGNEAAAAKALLHTDEMKIEDKIISVAISQPPNRKKLQTTEDTAQIESLGKATSSRTGIGARKTLLSMIPHNVKINDNNGYKNSTKMDIAQPKSNQDFRSMFLNKK